MDLIKELNKEQLAKELTPGQIGDTVRVHVKVKEGSRERIQVFEGTVIAKKHGGIEETIKMCIRDSSCSTACARRSAQLRASTRRRSAPLSTT